MMRSTTMLFLCVLSLAIASGCATRGNGPYTVQTASTRNPLEAQRLTQDAAAVVESDPEKAEQLLREALTADLYHGPAHNNLGVLYLERGELYEAASELEWARKLMPGHPDPRLNLALTLERAGRFDDAIDEYRSALEVYPGHIQSIQALTRCQLRHRSAAAEEDPVMRNNLREIALRGDSELWRAWAQKHLILVDGRGER